MTMPMNIALLMRLTKLKKPSTCSIEILEEPLIPDVSTLLILELKVAINSLGIEAKAQAVYQMIA
jgi:hypothetical protein